MTAIDTDLIRDENAAMAFVRRILRGLRVHFSFAEDPTDTAERRAFVIEMLDRNPDAFASEYDVESMLRHFPSHF